MNRVALICPGPSSRSYWHNSLRSEYELVVAVNAAGHHFTCDYLASVDKHIIEPFLQDTELPDKGFLTNHAWASRLRAHFPELSYQHPGPYHGQDVPKYLVEKMHNDRCGYTMPNALHFINKMEPASIDIFGFDVAIDQGDISNGPGDRRWLRWFNELHWLKGFWPENASVISSIDSRIVEWLHDGNKSTDPPLPDKHE